MNNTEQEYSDADLAAIALARETHLLGNTATPAAVARFAEKLKLGNKAYLQAASALHGVAAQIVQEVIKFEQLHTELYQQGSVVILRKKLLNQLHVASELVSMAEGKPCNDFFAMLDDREALQAHAGECQQRAERAESELRQLRHHHCPASDGNLLLREDGYPHASANGPAKL